MTTLYELSDKKLQALQIIDEMMSDGCSDAEMQEAYGLLNQLDENFNEKAVNVAMYARNLDAEAEAIAEAKKSMDAREKALKTKSERLKNYLLSEMQRTETKQIKCPYFVLSLRNNPASLKIDANAVIDEGLLLLPKPREPDKNAIKELLKKGVVVDGCSLVSGQSLSIK